MIDDRPIALHVQFTRQGAGLLAIADRSKLITVAACQVSGIVQSVQQPAIGTIGLRLCHHARHQRVPEFLLAKVTGKEGPGNVEHASQPRDVLNGFFGLIHLLLEGRIGALGGHPLVVQRYRQQLQHSVTKGSCLQHGQPLPGHIQPALVSGCAHGVLVQLVG